MQPMKGPGSGKRVVAHTGLALSVVGALLDFASGYTFAPMEGGMAMATTSEIFMYLLGAVLIILGILSVTPLMAGRMRWSGIGMEVLGVIMALVSGLFPGMNEGISDAMLVVGALMIINGILMQRNRVMKKEGS